MRDFPQDWSSFVPDLLVALFMGVAVGVAVFVIERHFVYKEEVRMAEKKGRRVIHPLMLVVQRPAFHPKFEQLGALSGKERETLTLLESSDFDDWHEGLPSPLTVGLFKYRSALRDQRHDREDLARAVEDWANKHSKESEKLTKYAEAILLGAHPEFLKRKFQDDEERSRLEGQWLEMRGSKHVKAHRRRFRSACSRCDNALTVVYDDLILMSRRMASERKELFRRVGEGSVE